MSKKKTEDDEEDLLHSGPEDEDDEGKPQKNPEDDGEFSPPKDEPGESVFSGAGVAATLVDAIFVNIQTTGGRGGVEQLAGLFGVSEDEVRAAIADSNTLEIDGNTVKIKAS